MDSRFDIHNLHKTNPHLFAQIDPNLAKLQKSKYTFESSLLNQLPQKTPGIYTLGGGRQIGKTTLLKQWISKLLSKKVKPETITFLTGEIIDDHHALINVISNLYEINDADDLKYIIVDEVTYVKDWDKGIKFLADSGFLENVILVLSGSELTFIKEARMRFPGRRGNADKVDFNIYPLSFQEVLSLKYQTDSKNIKDKQLSDEFKKYLIHGGYLTAINDFETNNKISTSTLNTYSDWIRGDVIKKGKSEHYLKETLQAIIKSKGSQITWNSLSHHLSIDHPKTVQGYVELLQDMDALFIQSALIENKLVSAPKKAKKLFFTDPFIFHAINHWISPTITQAIYEPLAEPFLVETVLVNHFQRKYPTYYIKAAGEVDIAYIKNNKFFPIEIKWTNQLRSSDLKQISKYQNALILSKTELKEINGIKNIFIPKFLANFTI